MLLRHFVLLVASAAASLGHSLAKFPGYQPDELEPAALAASHGQAEGFDPTIQLAALGGIETTKTRILHPTYNIGANQTELEWVAQCLAQWCERDSFLEGKHGKVRCYTSSDRPGGGVVAFACNAGRAARCSRLQIRDTMSALFATSKAPTGWAWLDLGKGMELALGFDSYCQGGHPCGKPADPLVAACDASAFGFQNHPVQWEREIDENSWKMNEDNDYRGTTWASLPTASPARVSLSYPTITAAP